MEIASMSILCYASHIPEVSVGVGTVLRFGAITGITCFWLRMHYHDICYRLHTKANRKYNTSCTWVSDRHAQEQATPCNPRAALSLTLKAASPAVGWSVGLVHTRFLIF